MKKDRTTKTSEPPTTVLVPTHCETTGNVFREGDEPISAFLGETNAIAGYTGGGVQFAEADEK